MKKFLYFALVTLICSCSSQSNNERSQEKSDSMESETLVMDSEESIVEQVREIYSFNEESVFSSDFQELINRVSQYDEENIPAGELGYFDYDILTQAQDEISIESISISEITATTCIARIVADSDHLLIVNLVKENNVWVVDDVNGEREKMTEYLTTNSNS